MEIEKFASAAAIGGFIVTSIGFLYGMWKDQRLRERERRVRLEENEIRRIEVTERFLNGIWNKSLTRHALYMIDYPEKEYLSETGERYLINKNDIKSALTFLKNKDLDDQKKYFIRECFDSLGNDLDFLNNLYARGLVNTQIIDSYLRNL